MSFDNSDNGDNFQQNAINISVQLYIECMCSVIEQIFLYWVRSYSDWIEQVWDKAKSEAMSILRLDHVLEYAISTITVYILHQGHRKLEPVHCGKLR